MTPPTAELNPFLEGWLHRLGSEGPVLDLGCGHGFWVARMAKAGLRVVGLEPDVERAAEAARPGDKPVHGSHGHSHDSHGGHGHGQRKPGGDSGPVPAPVPAPDPAPGGPRLPVVAGDGARVPVRNSSVGLVWCIHVLHHLDDPVEVLGEIRRVLRPGGHLVLAETVEDNPVIRSARRVRPEWDGVPIRSRFTSTRLVELLERAGFEVVDRRQHSLVSFAAWALPGGRDRAWRWLSGLEGRLPERWTDRWGAHLEVVARRA